MYDLFDFKSLNSLALDLRLRFPQLGERPRGGGFGDIGPA